MEDRLAQNGPTASERDALVNRQIPQMTLSNGTSTSFSAPPPPMPHYLNAEGRSLYRFGVEGTAVITGGGGTLALESARALLEHGASGLALLDIEFNDDAQSTILQLSKDFPTAKIATIIVDVTDSISVTQAFASAATQFESLDVLCCFAGIVGVQHASDLTAAGWRKVLDVNTTGAFLCAQAFANLVIKQNSSLAGVGRSSGWGGASIVFIASISGHRVNYPQPQVAYNVSKSALLHLSHSLAAEWAVHGIRVNTISPGYMDTILNEGPGLERARRVWGERNPMGRMGVPSELAGPLVMLCSRAGSYVNGADLVVDGGQIVF